MREERRRGEQGAGAYSFVACPGHLVIDHASLSRSFCWFPFSLVEHSFDDGSKGRREKAKDSRSAHAFVACPRFC